MIEALALTLTGFSLCAALLLLLAQWTVYRDVELAVSARVAGVVLLLSLMALQGLHAAFLLRDTGLPSPIYQALLWLAAPAFFLFFRGALLPTDAKTGWRWALLLPALLALGLPQSMAPIATPLAFASGGIYALILMRLALNLRGQRKRYRLEAIAFAAHGALALIMLLLGLALPVLGLRSFVLGYSILIGVGFFGALYTLLRIPDLAANTAEAVRSAYANSALKSVDVPTTVAHLQHLMVTERVYTNESLSLALLAQLLDLSTHQLSELINTHFGVGFSRYVREQRVAAAQRMLIDEPNASVLSVGLAVGFTSQSNFYAAFREISGEVPGRFRRQQLPKASP